MSVTRLMKLSSLMGDQWIRHVHAPVYHLETTPSGTPRLLATVPEGDSRIVSSLLDEMTEPLLMLYVLHTPRGEGDPGRYQSPELRREQVQSFLQEHWEFLASDARFDLWLHAPLSGETLVWDRHDLLYAYGNQDGFRSALEGLGFGEGIPEIPSPHSHHYHADLDRQAAQILESFEWRHSPLRPEDEQFQGA